MIEKVTYFFFVFFQGYWKHAPDPAHKSRRDQQQAGRGPTGSGQARSGGPLPPGLDPRRHLQRAPQKRNHDFPNFPNRSKEYVRFRPAPSKLDSGSGGSDNKAWHCQRLDVSTGWASNPTSPFTMLMPWSTTLPTLSQILELANPSHDVLETNLNFLICISL